MGRDVMEKPWEIVQKFQKQLSVNSRQDKLSSGKVQAVQRFAPFRSPQDVAVRIKKVKDMVDESIRITDESKLRALNNTTSSFCHNCSCTNCLNQSSALVPADSILNNTVSELYQSFDVFLNTQRQQFMQMMNHLMMVTDTSSNTTKNLILPVAQPTSMECDSSDKSKPVEAEFISRGKSPEKCGAQHSKVPTLSSPCESPSSTVHADEDDTLTTANEDDTLTTANEVAENNIAEHNLIAPSVPQTEESSISNAHPRCDRDLDRNESTKRQKCTGQNFEELFSDYDDIAFRPIRKSSFGKLKTSFLADQPTTFDVDLGCDINPDNSSKEKKHGTRRNKVENNSINSSEDKVISSRSKNLGLLGKVPETTHANRTRSGRTVAKPKEYWLPKTLNQKSGTHVLETIPEATGQRRGRETKQVAQAKSAPAPHPELKSRKNKRVQPMQEIEQNIKLSNNGTEKKSKKKDTKRMTARQKIDLKLQRHEDTTEKDATTNPKRKKRSKKEVKVPETDSNENKKQASRVKRKAQSNLLSTDLCKRKRVSKRTTRQISKESMEPEYECYFEDERADSLLET